MSVLRNHISELLQSSAQDYGQVNSDESSSVARFVSSCCCLWPQGGFRNVGFGVNNIYGGIHTQRTEMPSARYKTAMAFIGDFETLDVTTMLSRRTKDCMHTFLPSSMALPPKDNAAFGEHISRLREVMPKFPVIAKEVMEDERKNVAIVHAVSQAYFYDAVKDDGIPPDDWTYQGEYIFVLTMTEAGDKVEKVVEFVDSKGTERLLGLIKRARANKEKVDAEKA